MNDNIAEGRWKRIRGSAKELRGNLTGNTLDRTEGKLEKLAVTPSSRRKDVEILAGTH